MSDNGKSFADLMADAGVPFVADPGGLQQQREAMFRAVERAIMRAREELAKAMVGSEGVVIYLDWRDWSAVLCEAPRHMGATFHIGQNNAPPYIEILGAKVMEKRK